MDEMINETIEEQTNDIVENGTSPDGYDETSGIGVVAVIAGVGIVGGIVIHKWVIPAACAVGDAARKAIINLLTKNEERTVVEPIEAETVETENE